MPEEALRNVPLVALHGRRLACVENHRGIAEYSDTLVRVSVGDGCVCIRGSGLHIARMTRRCVEIRGAIFSAELS